MTCQSSVPQLHQQQVSGQQRCSVHNFMNFPLDALSYKHDVIFVFRTNSKILMQTCQNLRFKHLATSHEQVVNMKANEAVWSASLCIVTGHRIHKVMNCFRNTYLLKGNAARRLITLVLWRIIVQDVSAPVCASWDPHSRNRPYQWSATICVVHHLDQNQVS